METLEIFIGMVVIGVSGIVIQLALVLVRKSILHLGSKRKPQSSTNKK